MQGAGGMVVCGMQTCTTECKMERQASILPEYHDLNDKMK